MRPKQLTICAWGPYKEEEHIDFTVFEERGIFLITGPTGAGKTTIFDAITYALYGALSGDERDKERGSVRSDFADPKMPTYVELIMEHGGQIYRIRRNPEYNRPRKRQGGERGGFTREKENAVLTCPDGRIIEGVREVNAALTDLLVLDYQQYKKISMIAQGEFARLLVAAPKDKTRIFREIFDTGVCERFTRSLGQQSRRLQQAVTEDHARMQEDIRMLTAGLSEGLWPEETAEALLELTRAENWNYEELLGLLKDMEKLAADRMRRERNACAPLDSRIEELSKQFASLQEENRNRQRLAQVCAERERLAAEADEQKKREQRLELGQRAQQAAEAETALEHRQREVEKSKTMWEQLEKRAVVERDTLERMRSEYLEKETRSRELTEAYEEADRIRRRSAIGIAVSMLETGKPCPVCGSVNHPSPASPEGCTITEAQLQEKKDASARADRQLREYHAQVAAQAARVEEVEAQKKTCEEALREEQSNLKQAEAAFADCLRVLCFDSAQAYQSAKLSARDADRLRQQMQDYRSRVAGNEELYQHLLETVKETEPLDLEKQKEALDGLRRQREECLSTQRIWSQHMTDVSRARKLMEEKLARVQEHSRVYGYVKDLENLASGNNARRLVFEQYVLAGYFEEILRAANIRFRRMTSGRYEMSRAEEVGDGRVKDNLEIQVMDFYTGKSRSVRTLSGGESFKASLALALGMSDVIQAMNGGIRVDTLFVDEGFGALDEESLEQACDALMGLVEKNHMIGIISHVQELGDRIRCKLVIEKSNTGSKVRTVV